METIKDSKGTKDKEMPNGIPDILDLGDLAILLRITKPTAKKLVVGGAIPGYRFLKGKYLISKRQLIKTIESKSRTVNS